MKLTLISISFLIILFSNSFAFANTCFSRSRRHGCSTVGGRGGKVFIVQNLNNTGPGSFREACEAKGARIVVFAVSGHIHLTSNLYIENPNITIAGQSSPGGICISGGMTVIQAHDVVINHMRFRLGSDVL